MVGRKSNNSNADIFFGKRNQKPLGIIQSRERIGYFLSEGY
jgi:hypothetical protein